MAKISVTWPDGALTVATSWEELEEKVRALQWQSMTTDEFRRSMRLRAMNLHGVGAADIPVDAGAEALFRGLERFDMLRLDEWTE